jgi:hypothetical protein
MGEFNAKSPDRNKRIKKQLKELEASSNGDVIGAFDADNDLYENSLDSSEQ